MAGYITLKINEPKEIEDIDLGESCCIFEYYTEDGYHNFLHKEEPVDRYSINYTHLNDKKPPEIVKSSTKLVTHQEAIDKIFEIKDKGGFNHKIKIISATPYRLIMQHYI